MNDNFIVMMRGFLYKLFTLGVVLFLSSISTFALESVGILTDTILTPVNYYNAYYRTPEFFAQDVRSELIKRGMTVVPIDKIQTELKNLGLRQYDLETLQGFQQGYNIEYPFLKRIAKKIGVKRLVVITMGMDVQRDFLKNTIWNITNVSGMDVVNPTHRVNVYCGLVDVEKEVVVWESIYAKNIRNNKMKNLDTAISNNYEGMLRLKEYSKYISPDIAYNVKMKILSPYYVEPPTAITRTNIKQYVKDKHNIGVKKELSEIERQKWDTDKFTADSKTNTVKTCRKIKNGLVNTGKKIKTFFTKKPKKEWL